MILKYPKANMLTSDRPSYSLIDSIVNKETKNMVISHPIVIAGLDSRFEYDLNRAPETAIYEDAWGKQLWHSPLPAAKPDSGSLLPG